MILLSNKVHGICAAKSLTNNSTDTTVLSAALSSSSVTHFIFGGGGGYACFFGAQMKVSAVGHRARHASFGRARKGQ